MCSIFAFECEGMSAQVMDVCPCTLSCAPCICKRVCVCVYMCNHSHADSLHSQPLTPSAAHSEMKTRLLAFLCLAGAAATAGAAMREYLSLPHDVGATRTPTSGPSVDVACASACSHSAECVGFVWNGEKVRMRVGQWASLLGLPWVLCSETGI